MNTRDFHQCSGKVCGSPPFSWQPILMLKMGSLFFISIPCLGPTFSSLPWSVSQGKATFLFTKRFVLKSVRRCTHNFCSQENNSWYTVCLILQERDSPSVFPAGMKEAGGIQVWLWGSQRWNKPVLSITGQAYIPHSPLMHYLTVFITQANHYFNSREHERQVSEPDLSECHSRAQPVKPQLALHAALVALDLTLSSADAAHPAKQVCTFLTCRNGHTGMNDQYALPNPTIPCQETMDQDAGENHVKNTWNWCKCQNILKYNNFH